MLMGTDKQEALRVPKSKWQRVEDRLSEFRDEIHKEMTNMHVELIRQFQIQLVLQGDEL